jgi:hypothetical protein
VSDDFVRHIRHDERKNSDGADCQRVVADSKNANRKRSGFRRRHEAALAAESGTRPPRTTWLLFELQTGQDRRALFSNRIEAVRIKAED